MLALKDRLAGYSLRRHVFFKGKDKKLILNSSNDMCDNDLLDASNIRIYNDGHRFFS